VASAGATVSERLLPGDLRWRVPSRSAVRLKLLEELAVVVHPAGRSMSIFAGEGCAAATLELRRAPNGWGGCLRAERQ
jgi:hypothetical protein